MKILIFILCITTFFAQQVLLAETDSSIWENYSEILQMAVSLNEYETVDGVFGHSSVDYRKIKNTPEIQQKIKHQLMKLTSVKEPGEQKQKLAFWINAYNFFTIVDIVDNYPVKSMKEIGWKTRHHTVNHKSHSLDDIEHKFIRPLGGPRIHFAINCASVGCPSLKRETYTGDKIDTQLDKAVINALKNPLHLRLATKDILHTTLLFKWFKQDFKTGKFKGIENFVHLYAPKRLRKIKRIKTKIEYDWALNTEQNIQKRIEEVGKEFPALFLREEHDTNPP
ncbi:MAG: DUF547 domain-containing protein [Planctomycetes bacterium]|nr:DUF547 domain-containing protein [Planctomycetota bacterium]